MRKKLRSSEGMTLTELLVALAIVALIGIALTVGVSSAAKIYRDSTRLFEAETLCGTILTYLEDEFRFCRNIDNESLPGGSGETVVFDSQLFGKDVRVFVDNGKIKIGKKNDPPTPDPPTPDSPELFDLLSDTAYTNGLMVQKCDIFYDKTSNQVTITVAVGPDDTHTYVKHKVTVVPVNK